ncbi:MAG: hypothetical protein LBB42_02900 [Coriobacteriales bacterium]|jgi:hypothetical protein|nr:hypothetical protein [Coriobacteriales bacterium]
MVCQKCGMSFEGDAAFCPFCGVEVAAAAPDAFATPDVQPVVQEAYAPPTYAQPVNQDDTFQSQPSYGQGMGQMSYQQGYPQSAYGQPQQMYAAPVPRSAGSGMGLASLILGIFSAVSVPLFFIIGLAVFASADQATLNNPETFLMSNAGVLVTLALLMVGGVIAGIIGLLLGIVGRSTARKVGGLTGSATVGLVLSIIGLSIWILLFVLVSLS